MIVQENTETKEITITLSKAEANALWVTLDAHICEYGIDPLLYDLDELIYERLKKL